MSTYGIYLKGRIRPKSKKEVRFCKPEDVVVQGTSPFDTLIPDGCCTRAIDLPDGTYYFVGPDPYTSRKFYGTIKKFNGKVTVS